MQSGTRKILRFLGNWVINTTAVALTVIILRNHISYGDKPENLLFASFLLGILNAFVRPILMVLTLPLMIFTLGLFRLVINALLLCLLSALSQYFQMGFFHVDTFGYAFLGALIISFICVVLGVFTGGNARITVHRRPLQRPGDKNNGNGPVIDV